MEVKFLKAPFWVAGYESGGRVFGRKTKYFKDVGGVRFYLYSPEDEDLELLEVVSEGAAEGKLELPKDEDVILYLTAKMNSSMNLYSLLKSIERYVSVFLGAEAVSILVEKEENGESYMAFLVTEGGASGRIESIKVPMNSIAGTVYVEEKTMIFNDLEKEKRHFKGVDKAAKFVTRNIVASPIWAGDKKFGVIEALNKEGGFDDRDAKRLEMFSKLIGKKLHAAIEMEGMKNLMKNIVLAIASAIDKRDKYTHQHSRNVAKISKMIAEELGLSVKELEDIELSAILHDVGKIGIPDSILLKPGRLTKEEFDYIKKHPVIGAKILSKLKYVTDNMILGALEHHERCDGSGYPDGKMGDQISLFGRIIAVADVYDALTAKRVYKEGWDKHKVLGMLKEDASKGKFDPKVVEALERLINKGAL